MRPGIINVRDVELMSFGQGGRFQAQHGNLNLPPGANQLGARLVVLQPGKCAWPLHNHYHNQELFYILDGIGKIRYGDGAYPVEAGDLITTQTGGPDTAHQIVNDSDAELRYIAFGANLLPDVVEYPESGKLGVIKRMPREGETFADVAAFFPATAAVGYWDGEEP